MGRRDFTDRVKGEVVGGEKRDVADSARWKGSFGRDVMLQTVDRGKGSFRRDLMLLRV